MMSLNFNATGCAGVVRLVLDLSQCLRGVDYEQGRYACQFSGIDSCSSEAFVKSNTTKPGGWPQMVLGIDKFLWRRLILTGLQVVAGG
jgi:hypothetical protein